MYSPYQVLGVSEQVAESDPVSCRPTGRLFVQTHLQRASCPGGFQLWHPHCAGTRKVERLEQNAAAAHMKLTAAEMEELGAVFGHDGASGERWTDDHMKQTYHYGNHDAVAAV